MKLTRRYICNKVKKLAKEQVAKRQPHFCTLKDARRILVLCDAEDRVKVASCLKSLHAYQKEIQCYMYVTDEVVPKTDATFQIIHEKSDLNMWYMPVNKVKKAFCSWNADILIDLTRADNHVMKYLLLNHPCKCKVGVKNNESDLYDIAIIVTENTTIMQIFGHILFYLQTIRS